MAEDLTLTDIKDLHDKNYLANQDTRRRAADDRVFAWVTNWDDTMLADSENAYRGEFNIIRKAQRQIQGELRSNQVQLDFQPKNDTSEDIADLLDGMYLTDDRRNSTLEAYDNATLEAVDCGLGGWELYTEYESNRAGESNQVIRRRPIHEANNNSFPDANAKLLDKSDAMNWSVLEPFSIDGYFRLYEKLVGEEHPDASDPSSFAFPEQSYVFPWIQGEDKVVYICRFYHKTEITDNVLTFIDPLGNPLRLLESQLDEVMDDMIDDGYEIVESKEIKRFQVKRYICSGEKILKVEEVPGENIPVVHTYGERTFIEGEEIWEGVVRLAKDPQRLRNFLLSYMAEIVSRSPREKPIFAPEQISGYEWMYEMNGADNNYPFYYMNRLDENGNELPPGPLATLPSAQIPVGLEKLAAETREAVNDVANPGLPNDMVDPDLSGYAIEQLQARFDQQSIVYQQNLKHAKRWDGVIYTSMAASVYDAPRKVTITKPDGTRQQVEIMQMVVDKETGEPTVLNDLTNSEFEVFADIGQSYTSKKEKTRDELGQMATEIRESDPNLHRALMMKRLMLMDGVGLEDIRDYVDKQLLLGGFREPENEEEEQLLAQAAQQQQQPDAETLLAMAEMAKAEASMAESRRKSKNDEYDNATDRFKALIDQYKARTDRMDVMVDAEKTGAEIDLTKAKTLDVRVDAQKKITEPYRSRVNAT